MANREFTNINGIKVCDQTARDKIPTKTSQLENDSDYVTTTQVNQAIDNAQLGGGEVDLSGYVTKETGNANQITFADGQTFQAKLDAGILKGDTGAIGPKGEKGDKGDPGVNNINDTTASATTTYSSNKIERIKENLSSQIKEIVNSENIAKNKPQSYPCGIIYLDGDTTGMTKENAVLMDILIVDEYGDTVFQGKSSTAWQGSGSLQYPNKNLSLKLKDYEGNKKKLKIYDYETSTYHLKCNYVDYSMVRNSVGAQMVWDFDNTEFPVNAPITIKSKPVIMYLNGEFNGCYTLNLKQDDDLFGMDSISNPLTNIVYRSGLGSTVLSNFEYRSDGDETPEVQAKLTRLLDFINNSNDSTFKSQFNNYLDLNNSINYWIFADLACATDSTINNWTLATWDGNKWYMCWYDLDIIFGLYRNSGISYHPSNPTTDLLNCQYTKTNPIWEKLYNNFFDEIKMRYWELRNNGTINASRIVNQFRAFQSIWGTENITKERNKWSNRINKTDDIDMMYSWITQRINYLDAKYVDTIPCNGITLNQSTLEIDANSSTTATLIATLSPVDTTDTVIWSVEPTGIVTVNNGTITAKADGTATITATCGDYSATCEVTVSGISSGEPPTDHTYVTYIESSGTQIINTNMIMNDYGQLYVKFLPTSWNKLVILFGTTTTTTTGITTENQLPIVSNALRIDMVNTSNSHKYPYTTKELYEYKVEGTSITLNEMSFTRGTFGDLEYPMCIFGKLSSTGVIETNTLASMRLYEFYYKSSDGTSEMHLLPVLDSNGVACLYDEISGTYLYNQGTGDFLYGTN